MTSKRKRPAIGAAIYLTAMCFAAIYFMFASVQGDYGLFQRIQIEAERDDLMIERDKLQSEITALENKTRRLSDDFLDLDLLDEQARDVLGLVRTNEIVLR